MGYGWRPFSAAGGTRRRWRILVPVALFLVLLGPGVSGCTRVESETPATTQLTVDAPLEDKGMVQATALGGASDVAASASMTSSTSSTTTSATTPSDLPVIAWQPSHQDDTGDETWHEYVVCGDIVKRVVESAPGFTHVLAWELDMGLWGTNNDGGTNRDAFDSELEIANSAGADYFISVHNDGAAPSGVMGMYFAGDDASEQYASALSKEIAAAIGLPLRETRGVDLYSLDPVRNRAPIRVLLEIGDNVQDRELLEASSGRAKIASALAEALEVVSGTLAVQGE